MLVRLVHFPVLFLLAGVAFSLGAAWGQSSAPIEKNPGKAEPAKPAGESAAGKPEKENPLGPMKAEASELDTYFIKDAKGNLIPVVGMKFEEFENLLKLRKGLVPANPPSYTLDQFNLRGAKEQKQWASFQATANIRIREEGWVRVPLKLGKAILVEQPVYEGPGEFFTTFDEGGDGYVAWIKGAGAKPHLVKLRLQIPLTELGEETRLEMVLPRATESLCVLRTAQPRVQAALKAGNDGLVTTQLASDGQSEISVVGAAGELQLSWRPAQNAPAGQPTALECSGEIVVKVEGLNRVSSDAKLRVRSFGAALESFRVRTPAGMELVPTNPAGYTVTPVISAGADTPTADGSQLVDVKLDRPAGGVAEVRLLAVLKPGAIEKPNPVTLLEPGRFEVLSAVRQRGTIDFVADGDWSLEWNANSDARRVEVPTESAGGARAVARFEYFRQPCTLNLKIGARPSRISVEPSYLAYVEPRQVRLEATLKYHLRGAPPQMLSIEMGEWRLDKMTPDLAADTGSASPLQLQLRGAPVGAELEVKLFLHRDLAPADARLNFTLPLPAADSTSPANLIVIPADNITLTPRREEMEGLTADLAPPGLKLPPRQQEPLAFRAGGDQQAARFVADFQVRRRQTTVRGEVAIRFEESLARVEQRLHYRIEFEPQRTFHILAEPRIVGPGGLKVSLGGKALSLSAASDASMTTAGQQRWQFTTPADQIGECEIICEYNLPAPPAESGDNREIAAPLVIPEESPTTILERQAFVATPASGLTVEIAAPPELSPEAAGVLTEGRQLRATAPRLLPATRWILRRATGGGGGTRIAKMFLQTWLAPDRLQARAVWRFTTSAEALRIRLPADVDAESVEAALDGQLLVGLTVDAGVLRVPLPLGAIRREVVLEVWFAQQFTHSRRWWTQLAAPAPIIEGGFSPQAAYFLLQLPRQEHLIQTPDDWVSENLWKWKGLFWEPAAALSQAELERWIGVGPQDSSSGDAANQYLFSSFGVYDRWTLGIVARRGLIWGTAALTLALGLLFANSGFVQRPLVFFTLALLIVLSGFLAPYAAILVGQFAIAAVLVVVWIQLWNRRGDGRTAARREGRSISSIRQVEKRPTTLTAPRAEPPPEPSTAAAPLVTEPHP